MAIFATNRKANFNYEIKERFEAGIELLGFEVKSVRAGQVSLDGSRVIVRGGEAYLVGTTIQPFQVNNTPKDYEPDHTRRLLLSKKEILELEKLAETKGLTIVPLSMYNKNRHIKVELGVGRGKKLHDKRETIKKRDLDRQLKRDL
jgi:SsrA-binding protein